MGSGVPDKTGRLVGSGGFVQLLSLHTLAPQDQCVEITEESKALLEEYNKTVSFLLSQAPEE